MQVWPAVFVVLALVAVALAALIDGRNNRGCSSSSSSSKSKRCRAALKAKCQGYRWAQCNAVSDVNLTAAITDLDVVHPWGVAVAPCSWLDTPAPTPVVDACGRSRCPTACETGPLGAAWVALNGPGLLVEYELSRPSCSSSESCLSETGGVVRGRTVTVPSATSGTGFPSGLVTYEGDAFQIPVTLSTGATGPTTAPASLITATEDGLLVAWSKAGISLDGTAVVTTPDAVYKGLVVWNDKLYAANFHSGSVEIYDGSFALLSAFTDAALLSAGYAPFNVVVIDGELYVSFAKQDGAAIYDVAGVGNGYVDVFDANGVLLRRLINRGALNSPWALCPYGADHEELLVGNAGDGLILRYDRRSGRYLGALTDSCCRPIVIDGVLGVVNAAPCKSARCRRAACGTCPTRKHYADTCKHTSLVVAAASNARANGLVAFLNRIGSHRCPC